MAVVVEIKSVRKSNDRLAHERIEAVCGVGEDGSLWKMSVQEAIAGIEAGGWKFYIPVAGRPAWVVVAVSRDGVKYLKSDMDGDQPNWLLALPECSENKGA